MRVALTVGLALLLGASALTVPSPEQQDQAEGVGRRRRKAEIEAIKAASEAAAAASQAAAAASQAAQAAAAAAQKAIKIHAPDLDLEEEDDEELDDEDEKPIENMLEINEAKPGHRVFQTLKSDEGMAYYGELTIGGQPQLSIYDTGSFDVVVLGSCTKKEEKMIAKKARKQAAQNPFGGQGDFDISKIFGGGSEADISKIFGDDFDINKIMGAMGAVARNPSALLEEGENQADASPKCCSHDKCPYAGYMPKKSGKNFREDKDMEDSKITYGSGTVVVHHGYDHMQLAAHTGKQKIGKDNMPVSYIIDHKVDLFQQTQMQAIVGIGPGPIANTSERMLTKLGVQRFMMCFHEDPKKDGMIIWNDKNRKDDNEFVTVPVIGVNFWAVPTSKWKLTSQKGNKYWSWWKPAHWSGKQEIGCEPSCSAIIDSGTSLITAPKEIVAALTDAINGGEIEDCHDLSKFPTFSFKLGDHDFSLPPESYIGNAGSMTQSQVTEIGRKLALPPLPMLAQMQAKKADPDQCVLLLSNSDDMGMGSAQWGAPVIIGMPLFRKYAIQFDLLGDMTGKDHTPEKPSRFMHFSQSSADCKTNAKGMEYYRKRETAPQIPKVNVNKLRESKAQAGVRMVNKVVRGMVQRNLWSGKFNGRNFIQI